MRAACDSLIGLLAITLSGGYEQWTINKHKAALSAEQKSLQEGRMRGSASDGRALIYTGVRLATGEQEQCNRGCRRKAGLREQSFILY